MRKTMVLLVLLAMALIVPLGKSAQAQVQSPMLLLLDPGMYLKSTKGAFVVRADWFDQQKPVEQELSVDAIRIRIAVDSDGFFYIPAVVQAIDISNKQEDEFKPFFEVQFPEVDSLVIISQKASSENTAGTRIITEISLEGVIKQSKVEVLDKGILDVYPEILTLDGLSVVLLEDAHGESLLLNGKVDGQYETGTGFDLTGTLTLVPPFKYKKGKLTVDLKSGSLGVEVKASKFEKATVSAEADVDYEVESDVTSTLKINGKVNGQYTTGKGFDLTGTLTLVPPFEYKKGKLTVDLKSGSVGVEVKASQFEKATFLLCDAEAEIGIESDVTSTLKVKGKVDGKYLPGSGIHLTGGLTLMEDFVYEEEKVRVTYKGAVDVKIRKSEFKWARFQEMPCTVESSHQGKDLSLAGKLSGRYNQRGLSAKADLNLDEPFDYEKNGKVFHLTDEDPCKLKVKRDEVKWLKCGKLKFDVDDPDDDDDA